MNTKKNSSKKITNSARGGISKAAKAKKKPNFGSFKSDLESQLAEISQTTQIQKKTPAAVAELLGPSRRISRKGREALL